MGSPREVADEEDSVEARGVSDLVLLWCSQNRMGRHQTAKVRPGSGRLDKTRGERFWMRFLVRGDSGKVFIL